MFHLFPVSFELFVRQTVYVYEFLVPCLTKYVEVFIQIYIILPLIIVLFEVSSMQRDIYFQVTYLSEWPC